MLMTIVACVFLLVLGLSVLLRAFSSDNKKGSSRTSELSARVGRSLGGASHAIPGLTTARGQPPPHLMPGPIVDEIGPDESHIYVVPSAPDEPEESADPAQEKAINQASTEAPGSVTDEPAQARSTDKSSTRSKTRTKGNPRAKKAAG